MRALVDKKLFLNQALPLVDAGQLSVTAHGGLLTVASFGNAVNFRVPANVTDAGQVQITPQEWQKVVQKASAAAEDMVDIEL